MGRDFTAEDHGGRIGYVAIISHDLWRRRFGGDREIVGKTVRLDDDPMTIIGVMPADFTFPYGSMLSPTGFSRSLTVDVWFAIARQRAKIAAGFDAGGTHRRDLSPRPHNLALGERTMEPILTPDTDLAHDDRRVADHLDPQSRLVLCRRLVREGLLEVVR